MGRPIKKSFFGNPAQPGNRIALTSAWVAGEVGPAAGFYIVRQVGTGRFQVTNGDVTGVVRLVDGEPLSAGKACLAVQPFGVEMPVEYARMLHNRSVKTFDGHNYKWSTDAAKAEGEADIFGVEMPSAPSEPDEPAVTPMSTRSRKAAPAPVEPTEPVEPAADADSDSK